jgi:hypothetical protein
MFLQILPVWDGISASEAELRIVAHAMWHVQCTRAGVIVKQ